MIELYNWSEQDQPNIFHFQGQSRYHYAPLFKEISAQEIDNDSRIHILTIATDTNLSPVIRQMERNNVSFINLWNNSYYCSWTNIKKIELIIDQLSKLQNKDIVLMMDGYDTAIRSLNGLYEKFVNNPYKILFNGTKHNWPHIRIDRYRDRDFVGDFCYFNAGVVMGYTKELLDFYQSSLKYIGLENPWKSEQFIIRHAWAEHSEEESRQIDFDHHCRLFQTMGSTQLIKIEENKYKII